MDSARFGKLLLAAIALPGIVVAVMTGLSGVSALVADRPLILAPVPRSVAEAAGNQHAPVIEQRRRAAVVRARHPAGASEGSAARVVKLRGIERVAVVVFAAGAVRGPGTNPTSLSDMEWIRASCSAICCGSAERARASSRLRRMRRPMVSPRTRAITKASRPARSSR